MRAGCRSRVSVREVELCPWKEQIRATIAALKHEAAAVEAYLAADRTS
jgi:hypothetical protein